MEQQRKHTGKTFILCLQGLPSSVLASVSANLSWVGDSTIEWLVLVPDISRFRYDINFDFRTTYVISVETCLYNNILVKARCSHIRKLSIKILHLKHIYAKTIFPNTPQDSFYSQYMYQMCHHDIRCCRCIWPFVGNRGDIFTLCLVFQCSLQVSNYSEVAFWLFFLNPQNTNKVFI